MRAPLDNSHARAGPGLHSSIWPGRTAAPPPAGRAMPGMRAETVRRLRRTNQTPGCGPHLYCAQARNPCGESCEALMKRRTGLPKHDSLQGLLVHLTVPGLRRLAEGLLHNPVGLLLGLQKPLSMALSGCRPSPAGLPTMRAE